MTFAKYSKAFKLSIALAVLAPAAQVSAQDAYVPPPMFEDMTPPMVRPEPKADGMIVEPKSSPNTVLPPSGQPRPAIVTPRVSVDPDSAQAPALVPAPPIPVQPPAAMQAPAAEPVSPPVQQPAPPKMMQPIVEETYIKREKPVAKSTQKEAQKEEAKTQPVKPVVPPRKPSLPVQDASKPIVPPSSTTAPAEQVVVPPVPVESAPAPVIPAPQPSAPVVIPSPPEALPVPAPTTPSVPAAKPSSADDRTQPVKRDPKVSAIQGPKVMPSLPVQGVEGEVTYQAAPDNASETILERHQKEVETPEPKKEMVPIVPAPKAGVTPATFDKGEQDALKKSIVYAPGQIGLVAADADPIAAGVSTELDKEEHKDWRVQIRSYATPHGSGLSSDRRIALSRALSLRTELIRQGVAAGRIDVLAEGLQTDAGKPGDRVDLYLYGPKKED